MIGRDIQQEPPRAYCALCGAELYTYDEGDLCPTCEEEEEVQKVDKGGR